MLKGKKEWLPHLENAIPQGVSDMNVSMYAMALEGWRRGLKLKFYQVNTHKGLKIRFSLQNNDREHFFSISSGDKISKEAKRVSKNKALTNEALLQAGVPVPNGKRFGRQVHDEDIVAYAKTLRFPLLIKPTIGSLSRGIVTDIEDEKTLRDGLRHVRQELNDADIIVQRYVKGDEIRVFVLRDSVLAAYKKIPANVIGDGSHTIEALMAIKNEKRRQYPHLRGSPITVDEELRTVIAESGYSLDTIPGNGKQVFLSKKYNHGSGADFVDITDQLTDEIQAIAVNGAEAIPGMAHCGMDIIFDANTATGVILELNTRPDIGSHLFPMEGKARDIPKAIIDDYFPETVNHEKKSMYFDYNKIVQTLKSQMTKTVTVSSLSNEAEWMVKAFKVSGHVQGVGYRQWIKTNAQMLTLNGFVENQGNGEVLVVVAGEDEDVDIFQSVLETKRPKKAEVKRVRELQWDKPVNVGFEIKAKDKARQLKKVKEELEMEREKNKELELKLQKQQEQQ